MKVRIKYLVILVILIGLAFRIWMVNKNQILVSKIDYQMKEEVVLGEGDSINKMSLPKGYAITVRESKLITKEELKKEYSLLEEDIGIEGSRLSKSNFYILHATVKNTNEEFQEGVGIYAPTLVLQYTAGYIIPDSDLFTKVNTHLPGVGFSLESHDEMEMTLIYPIIDTYKNAILKLVRQDSLYLVLSVEPELTRVQLQ